MYVVCVCVSIHYSVDDPKLNLSPMHNPNPNPDPIALTVILTLSLTLNLTLPVQERDKIERTAGE